MEVFRTALKKHLEPKDQNMFLMRMNRHKFDPSFRNRFMFGFHYLKPGIFLGIGMTLAVDFY